MLPFTGVRLNNIPLQVMVVISLIVAVGLMLIVTLKLLPVQFPEIGVTIYVAVLVAFVVFIKVPEIVFTGVT